MYLMIGLRGVEQDKKTYWTFTPVTHNHTFRWMFLEISSVPCHSRFQLHIWFEAFIFHFHHRRKESQSQVWPLKTHRVTAGSYLSSPSELFHLQANCYNACQTHSLKKKIKKKKKSCLPSQCYTYNKPSNIFGSFSLFLSGTLVIDPE